MLIFSPQKDIKEYETQSGTELQPVCLITSKHQPIISIIDLKQVFFYLLLTIFKKSLKKS
jgi:hypothetical protein